MLKHLLPIIQALKSKLKDMESTVLYYVACLVPVTVASFNISYLFLLQHGARRNRKIYNKVLQFFIFYLPVCYLLGLFTTVPLGPYAVFRQFVSLVAFLLPCSLLFVSFDKDSLKRLLDSIVVISFLYSLWVLIIVIINIKDWGFYAVFFTNGSKGLLRSYVWAWPQYFVPVLMFAFFILLARKNKKIVHYASFVIILIVLYLTHTRAMYLALGAGLGVFVVLSLINLLKKKKIRNFVVLVSFILIVVLMIVFLLFQDSTLANRIRFMIELTLAPFVNMIQGREMISIPPRSGSV